MIRSIVSIFFISGLVLVSVFSSALSADAGSKRGGYRNGPQVKGFTQRKGGYSYNYAESINTYGDSRSNYGGASVFRDPMLDRQTNAGPFDHGFFFDSGMTGTHGGDSPYMH